MKYSLYIVVIVIFSCSNPKARKPVSHSSNTFIEESIKRNKILVKREKELFEEIIKKDTIHTYIASPNGFWYFYNHKIDTVAIKPTLGDKVIFSYEIRDVTNTIIYTKEELGDRSLQIDSEDFISGINEGLKLMKQNETVTFLFPSNKVFGVAGFQDRITTNQSLIIEVYLKELIHNNNQ